VSTVLVDRPAPADVPATDVTCTDLSRASALAADAPATKAPATNALDDSAPGTDAVAALVVGDVLGADVEVTLADGRRVPYANLDYAASAPCLRVASDAVSELLPYYASVHRGAGALSQLCTARFEQARVDIAAFLGCRAEDQVVFTRNTTDALNLLARVLPPRTTVVTFAGEHHANLLPWHRVVRLPVPASAREAVRSVDAALRELRRDCLDDILVSVTGASNVTGELWPIEILALTAHRHGARIVVDAAQLAPHRPLDIAALGLDYVALSGHKLYTPFGIGVLAGRGDWLDAAPPYLAGGGASAHVGDATHDIRWTTGAARHEGGTPNVVGAVALAAVCDALVATDRDRLAADEEALVTQLRSGLADIPGVRQLQGWPAHPRVGIVSFTVDGLDSAEVSARLARDHGVGVRDGLFCAHPFTRRLLLESGSQAKTAVRASVGLGSTAEHIDRLLNGLRTIAT
jgi:selenocysteine lyase/cysteine desulfurase